MTPDDPAFALDGVDLQPVPGERAVVLSVLCTKPTGEKSWFPDFVASEQACLELIEQMNATLALLR